MVDLGPLRHDIHARKGPGLLAVAELAGRQHGVVASWQLLAMGFGRGWIQHAVRSGRFHQLYVGVYAVGHAAVSARGRILAAVLACGPTALASHSTAGLVYVFLPSSRPYVDVTTSRSRKGQPGIRVHRVRALHPEDRAVVDGIP